MSRTEAAETVPRRLRARVIEGATGRGPQLNLGASHARSDILLFLHADTDLPPEAGAEVRKAIDEGAIGGAFLVRFDNPKWIHRIGERVVNLLTRWTRCPLGDQGQFVRREIFEELEGFRNWPILEDLDFMGRLKRRGRLKLIDSPVTTAARRYANRGVLRTLLTNWLIWLLYLVGVTPHTLARLYHDVR